MRLGVRGKLFSVSLLAVGASWLVVDVYLAAALDDALIAHSRRALLVRATMAAGEVTQRGVAPVDIAGWTHLAQDLARRAQARITIVLTDGTVVGDSDRDSQGVRQLENHARRPEIQAALQTGEGSGLRLSTSANERMMYAAARFSRGTVVGGVVRLAVPLSEVDRAKSQLRRVLVIASLLAVIATLLLIGGATHLVSRSLRSHTRAAARMAAGDLAARTRAHGGDELAELGRTLDQMAESLSSTLSALRDERDLLGGVLASMQEGVLVLDAAERVVMVNAALREMLLLSTDVSGQSLFEVTRHSELEKLLRRGRSSTEPVAAELEMPGLKPRRLWVHASMLPHPKGGQLAVCVDVTQTRRLESLRSDFVASASQELRTPVTAILSGAETLRSALTDPIMITRLVDTLERNAVRMQSLLDDLLDLSRLEAHEYHLENEPLLLAPMVERALAHFKHQAEAKSIVFANDVPQYCPPIFGDRRAVEQILTNLIDNAMKYCPNGALVAVSADASDREVRLMVSDTGHGIGPQHLPHIFERFYRVDPARSRELGGTGLGLSIVKHLAEAMGGSVSVDSSLGQGSTFAVVFPQALD